MLVVCHHAALAYTLGEGWPIKDTEQNRWLVPMLAVNASFFMGLFFFISGIFVPRSFEKSGAKKFIKDKVKRLLYPVVLMSLALSVFLPYYANPEGFGVGAVLNYIGTEFTFGHAWFLIILFFLSTLYIVFSEKLNRVKAPVFSLKYLFIIMLALSGVTWLVSMKYSINDWLFFHAVEPFHFPQYATLFTMGCLFARLKDSLTLKTTYWSFAISLTCIVLFVINFNVDFGLRKIFILWKCLLAIFFSLSLVGLFEKYGNYKKNFLITLSQCSFGVYITHIFTLVVIQSFLKELPLPMMSKFIISCLAGYGVSAVMVYYYYQIKSLILTRG